MLSVQSFTNYIQNKVETHTDQPSDRAMSWLAFKRKMFRIRMHRFYTMNTDCSETEKKRKLSGSSSRYSYVEMLGSAWDSGLRKLCLGMGNYVMGIGLWQWLKSVDGIGRKQLPLGDTLQYLFFWYIEESPLLQLRVFYFMCLRWVQILVLQMHDKLIIKSRAN